MASRALVVLPDDSARPILDAISAASKSIRVKMFVFSDPGLLRALIAAQRRGVKVRVMLNPARRSGEEDNEETRRQLAAGGIEVADSSPDFQLTHEKSMVVDEQTGFVQSLNWATRNLTEPGTTPSSPRTAARWPRWSSASRPTGAGKGSSLLATISSGARAARSGSPASSIGRGTRFSCKTSGTRTLW